MFFGKIPYTHQKVSVSVTVDYWRFVVSIVSHCDFVLHLLSVWIFDKFFVAASVNSIISLLNVLLSCLLCRVIDCMLMSLSIHLHGLHLDAQHGQTWLLSTQLCSGERTGRRLLCSTTLLLPTLLSRQPGFHRPRHTWALMNRFRTDQGPCHANLHIWGLTQSPSCDCGQWQTVNHVVNTYPLTWVAR